ncbi:MAG: hypothetical protein WC683_07920 [bacterium]|jgi:hypothetical protein
MTDLEVVNRALRELGCPEASSMSDTAKNPAAAIDAYSVCRDEVLRLLPWPACIKRASMKGWHDQATPWTASHAYRLGDRCTNDTAKTYECTTAGISASSGGPTGTTAAITDGTVVWKYMEASTTTNNWCWVKSTAYAVDDLVSNDTGKVYVCITAGTSAASGGPTGTTADITDNTVHWCYYGTPPENHTTFDYLFVLPPDCLRLLKIPSDAATAETTQGIQFRREGMWVYTNQDPSIAKYVRQETDPNQWDSLLPTVISMRIAAEIAYYVTGQTTKKKELEDRFASWYATARPVAMSEGAEAPEEVVRWEDV